MRKFDGIRDCILIPVRPNRLKQPSPHVTNMSQKLLNYAEIMVLRLKGKLTGKAYFPRKFMVGGTGFEPATPGL
jgi:hypothetical protein